MILRNPILGALTVAGVLGIASLAHGQTSCPADLSGLGSQITTPYLRSNLATPIDQIVAKAGGLSQAMTEAQKALNAANGLLSQVPTSDQASAILLNDNITILTAEIAALNCRINAGGH